MIQNSFIFLPKIQAKTEQNIWNQGVSDWDTFFNTEKIQGIHPFKKIFYDKELRMAQSELYSQNSSYFVGKFPSTETWRLFDFFRDETIFLDIETTSRNAISVIGLSDGFETKQFVYGMNFNKDSLKKLLSYYKLIVTFNGSSFDIPILNNYFQKLIPTIPHIDLRHVCTKIGLFGGLKKIESVLGITRSFAGQELFHSPLELWDRWQRGGEHAALQELLEYNEYDALNLKYLMEHCFATLKKEMLEKIENGSKNK